MLYHSKPKYIQWREQNHEVSIIPSCRSLGCSLENNIRQRQYALRIPFHVDPELYKERTRGPEEKKTHVVPRNFTYQYSIFTVRTYLDSKKNDGLQILLLQKGFYLGNEHAKCLLLKLCGMTDVQFLHGLLQLVGVLGNRQELLCIFCLRYVLQNHARG